MRANSKRSETELPTTRAMAKQLIPTSKVKLAATQLVLVLTCHPSVTRRQMVRSPANTKDSQPEWCTSRATAACTHQVHSIRTHHTLKASRSTSSVSALLHYNLEHH